MKKLLFIFVLLMLPVVSMLGALFRYDGYRLTLREETFRRNSGLLTRHDESLRQHKIQAVVWKQNFVARWLGRINLQIRQASAGSGVDGGSMPGVGKMPFMVPSLQPEQAKALTGVFLPESQSGNAQFSPIDTGRFVRVNLAIVLVITMLPLLVPSILVHPAWLAPLLPAALRSKVPAREAAGDWPAATHARRMIALAGCVQSVATPATSAAAARVLDRLGVSLITVAEAGCCGAVSHHLSAQEEGRAFMRRNIDAWWPYIEQGAEAIVITASGCGALVKEYGELLRDDAAYADKARRVSELAKDIGEVLVAAFPPAVAARGNRRKVAFHSPCTLQHGQQLQGVVEPLLQRAGFELTTVPDAHLCCGSAGTYSLLQPGLSQRLLKNKIAALEQGGPELIATANIGCQLHLAGASGVPVKHWIELLDEATRPV